MDSLILLPFLLALLIQAMPSRPKKVEDFKPAFATKDDGHSFMFFDLKSGKEYPASKIIRQQGHLFAIQEDKGWIFESSNH